MAPKLSYVLMSLTVIVLFLYPISSQARSLLMGDHHYHHHNKPSSPFEFIKDLQGCHKGDKVKGVHKLKKYLQQFGYLNHTHARRDDDDDDFDDLVESAVKTYQTNYHLKVTGNLDSETVAEMVRPRCGVADIVNGTTWMRSGKKKGHHHLHVHAVAHYSFFPRRQRWPASKTHLTYAFTAGTPAWARTPVSQAFGQWAAATHFTFAEAQGQGNADLTIGFHRRDHGDGAPFDGPGGTIAHAFAPTVGMFHYDAEETWGVVGQGSTNVMDLETVAVHEIGHLLGLGHSSVQDAIMFPTITSGVTKRVHQDDIQGIRVLYNRN